MDIKELENAKHRVPGVSVLINMISMRIHQLIMGYRPLVKVENTEENIEDVVIREIAEGKIVAEIDFSQAQSKERKR